MRCVELRSRSLDQMAAVADDNAELEMYFSGLGNVRLELSQALGQVAN